MQLAKKQSYDTFRAQYRNSAFSLKWYHIFTKRVWQTFSADDFIPKYRIPSIYFIGFVLSVRVPDRDGYFSKGRGQWCFPWNWYKLYYKNRVG